MHGAATSPDMHVYACAAAQVKKAIEVSTVGSQLEEDYRF
jgi:xylose isomerase